MFSLSYTSLHINLYQIQPPDPIDTRIFDNDSRKYKKHFHKTKGKNSANTYSSLNIPSCSKNSALLTHSHANALDRKDVFLHRNTRNTQSIDSSTIGHWLQSCSDIEEIRKIHGFVIKIMDDPSVFINNNLISAYVKFGDLSSARKVFDEMSQRTVVSWTAMLNGYQKYGTGNEALLFFSEFIKSGTHRNSKTFVCMLNLCSKRFDYELGRQLHCCILKNRFSGLILDTAILHFYAQCSDLEAAFRVFDNMQNRDVVSFTTMITACSQHKRGGEAFVIFSRMLSDGLDPNEFTLCSVLNACGEDQELKLGVQLHGTIVKKAYDLDVYVATSLIDMYAKCEKIDSSRTLFDGMKRKNSITWTSIIAGYACNGLGEEAITLFRVMQRLKISANNLTMVSVLRACGSLRALTTGKEVHARILKSFAPSNIFIGSALVWLYCKCRDYPSASTVLDHLPDKDVVSWTSMISGCSHLGHEYEALEYLKQMLGQGVEPNPFTYSSALKACANLENIEQGRLIHSYINKNPALSNVFVGSALVHMYSKCGYLSDAVQVFDDMPERNLVSWKAMIVGYARNGFCAEALKLMYRMRDEGIEVDDYVFSTVVASCGDIEWGEEVLLERCLKS